MTRSPQDPYDPITKVTEMAQPLLADVFVEMGTRFSRATANQDVPLHWMVMVSHCSERT